MNILKMLETQMLPEKYNQMSTAEMEERVWEIKRLLGKDLYIPAHHYQREEVFQFADDTGDSLQLAQLATKNKQAKYIVFCGVHFMAETADILTDDDQIVILPDMRAGCSMADMADIYQTEKAWIKLMDLFGDTIIPLTYVNSTAAIKAFVGSHGGACVTSGNAKEMVSWALSQKERLLFLPDQHLGRNTAYDLGIPLNEMAVWDPDEEKLIFEGDVEKIKVILWKGHCSVHEKFTVQNIQDVRTSHPNMKIIVHPECSYEVVQLADEAGSTNKIIQTIENSPDGSEWAIGTEMNLVNRIIKNHPNKKIISLNANMCACLTMNRIDLPHLLWSLENIASGEIRQQITVDPETKMNAKLALMACLDPTQFRK